MIRLRWAAAALGVGLALVAIRLDDRRVAWAALVVLGVALALRFAIPRQDTPGDGPDSTA
jgi:hypothetical protein